MTLFALVVLAVLISVGLGAVNEVKRARRGSRSRKDETE